MFFVQIDEYYINVEQVRYISPYSFENSDGSSDAGIRLHLGDEGQEHYGTSLKLSGKQSERFLAYLENKAQVYRA